MGTCLFTRALLDNGCIYLLIKNLFPSSECCFVVCFEVYKLQYSYITGMAVGVFLIFFVYTSQTDTSCREVLVRIPALIISVISVTISKETHTENKTFSIKYFSLYQKPFTLSLQPDFLLLIWIIHLSSVRQHTTGTPIYIGHLVLSVVKDRRLWWVRYVVHLGDTKIYMYIIFVNETSMKKVTSKTEEMGRNSVMKPKEMDCQCGRWLEPIDFNSSCVEWALLSES
jgi:hypothetical protein